MKLSNEELYEKAVLLREVINDNSLYLPAKANFRLIQNIDLVLNQVKKIEEARANIIMHYGHVNEDNTYTIPSENLSQANKELNDLLSLSNGITLTPIYLSWLKDTKLSMAQMNAIGFMIVDDQEE